MRRHQREKKNVPTTLFVCVFFWGGGLLPYLDEDDTLTDGQQRVQSNQDIVLAVLVFLGGVAAVDIELLDAVDRQLFGLECDLVGLRGNLFRKLAHTFGPGGREEDNLAVSWQESITVKRATFNITKNWSFLFLCLPFLVMSLPPTKVIPPKNKKIPPHFTSSSYGSGRRGPAYPACYQPRPGHKDECSWHQ